MKNPMKWLGFAAALLGLMAGAANQARADVTLTFDDLGIGSNQDVNEPTTWDYGGLTFETGTFQYVSGDAIERGAHDGTDVFSAGEFSTEMVSKTDGTPFTLKSFDIGLSYYTRSTDTVTLTLDYLSGGSSTSVLTLSQDFQTVRLDAANLTSVSFGAPAHTGYLALDNIVYTNAVATPEPSTMIPAIIFGLIGLGYGWRYRKTRPVAYREAAP